MKPVRFLQFSDAHLGSRLGSSKLRLPRPKQAHLRRDMISALHRLPELVEKYGVDVVLCPGDLWEDESIPRELAIELFRIFAELAPRPVVIAPGNHDHYHVMSYYHAPYFRESTGEPWPSNVVVFPTERPARLTLSHWRPDVDLYGSRFERSSGTGIHPAFSVGIERPEAISIALVHGALLDTPLSLVGKGGREETPWFSRADILNSGFDYVALGHYHSFLTVEDRDGNIRAAYGGIPVARGLDEVREHYILVGTIAKGGVDPSTLVCENVDPRRIHRLEVELDPSVRTQKDVVTRIRHAMEEARVAPTDIVYAELVGRLARDFQSFDVDEREFEERCFHFVCDWERVTPDYDVEALRRDPAAQKTVLGRFVTEMDKLEDGAAATPEERAIVQLARRLGLDALHGKEPRVDHALR